MSNVVIFNTTANSVQIVLNNAYPGTGPIAAVASTNSWAPNSQSIARSPAAGDPGTLAFGTSTRLSVLQGGSGQSTVYDVEIPQATNPLSVDVQLYVFYDRLVLVSPQSTSEQGLTTVVQGAKLSHEEAEKLKTL